MFAGDSRRHEACKMEVRSGPASAYAGIRAQLQSCGPELDCKRVRIFTLTADGFTSECAESAEEDVLNSGCHFPLRPLRSRAVNFLRSLCVRCGSILADC
jgi:hypothetical protein